MKLRTVIVLAGLGALAARRATAARRRPVALLEAGPPIASPPAPEAVAPGLQPPGDAAGTTGVDTAPGVAGVDAEPAPQDAPGRDEPSATSPAAEPFTPVPGLHLPARDGADDEPPGEPQDEAVAASREVGREPAPEEPAPEEPAREEPVPEDAPGPASVEVVEPEPSVIEEVTVVAPAPVEAPSEAEPPGPDAEPEVEAEPEPESEPAPAQEPAVAPGFETLPGEGSQPAASSEGPREAERVEAAEVDDWPVPAATEPLYAADPPPLPRVEDVPTGWSVVLYPGQKAPEDRSAPARVPPGPSTAPAPEPAAAAETAPPPASRRVDGGDARGLLLANQVPLVFVGATPFAMLGLDRIVGRLSAISVQDCFDGRHGSVYVPRGLSPFAIADQVSPVNALLADGDVVDRLRLRPGRIIALTADEETERLAESFGHAVALAPTVMRRRLGAQSELLHLARDAGVHALPAVTGHAGSYQDLLLLARGLGTDLLVESLDRPGQAPAPIGSLEDWSAHERRLGSELLRVTRRLDGPAYLLAGVVAADCVAVAPIVADARSLPGDPPYGGGMMVSDVADDLDRDLLAGLRAAVRAIGSRLGREGFRGMFEVELSVDRRGPTGPTLTAIRPDGAIATMLDTVSATAAEELPVLALHLAVQLGGALDATEEADVFVRRPWSFLIVEEASDTLRTVTEAPASGVWRLDKSAHGGARYIRSETDWRSVGDTDEVFYLRIARAGSVCAPGGALGVVVSPGRLTLETGQPTEAAQHWVKGIRRNVWTAAAPAGGEPTVGPPGLLAL